MPDISIPEIRPAINTLPRAEYEAFCDARRAMLRHFTAMCGYSPLHPILLHESTATINAVRSIVELSRPMHDAVRS